MSAIILPPATEAIFNEPLTALTTRMSPRGDLYLAAGVDSDADGRLDMQSPRPPALYSPILERLDALPLRISPTTPSTHSTSYLAPELGPQEAAEERYIRWRPWTPVHAVTSIPGLSRPPSRQSRTRNLSHGLSRSPIRRPSKPTRRRSAPRYHVTVLPSLASTLSSTTTNPSYATAFSHLRTPLVPLISVTTGLPHPEFPRTLLQYHLLTHDQLDALARWYHQSDPLSDESWRYPAPIPPFTAEFGRDSGVFADIPLETKRRRWGRFIGLRGCESPGLDCAEDAGRGEGVAERMEREWKRAMLRMREEKILREKSWRGRW